jgi:hypothetical protein
VNRVLLIDDDRRAPLNFVQNCFEENICDCIECLENVEFSVDQILNFLPEAASKILDATQSISLYQAVACMHANNPVYLLNAIDIDSMSSKLCMDSNRVVAGLTAVAPILLGDFLKQCEVFTHLKKGKKLHRAKVPDSTVEHLA